MAAASRAVGFQQQRSPRHRSGPLPASSPLPCSPAPASSAASTTTTTPLLPDKGRLSFSSQATVENMFYITTNI